jgi:putative lipoic acid-binding regulatory protein
MSDEESLLQFPTELPVKVFGRNDPAFREAVVKIFEAHYGQAYVLAAQQSAQANYLSFTITVRAESRAQVDALYKDLVAHELVLMAL